MLAEGRVGVNGKCVLVCTIDENVGSKLSRLTSGHDHFPEYRYFISLITHGLQKQLNRVGDLHSNCDSLWY
jgi:hypothetical protein